MVDKTLTVKDEERLEFIIDSINKGLACTVDKNTCISHLDGILKPKCCVCRGIIGANLIVINDRKMHESCRSRYRG